MSAPAQSLGSLRIGCAGFQNPVWRKDPTFYPRGTKQADEMDFYCKQFATTEINTTFYAVPRAETVLGWAKRAPPRFEFALKMSKALTHDAQFAAEAQRTRWHEFWAAAQCLGDKLGPILIQLPPWVRFSMEKLESFAREVPAGLRFAFDFRDKSWLCDAVFAFLRERDWAYVIHQHPHLDTHVTTTASFAYVRLHGPAEPLHETSYAPEQLAEWAQIVHGIRARGVACHVFFLNDRFSPANAKEMRRLCAELAGEPIYHLDSKRGQISSFFGAAAASNSKPNALSTKPVADSGSSNATTAAACLVGDVDGPPLLELPAQPVSSSTTSPLFSSSAVDSSQSSRNEDVSSSGSSVKRSSAHVIDLSIGESDDNDSGKGRKSFQLDSVASEKKPKLASILSPAPSASSRANAKANPPPSAGKITGFFRPK